MGKCEKIAKLSVEFKITKVAYGAQNLISQICRGLECVDVLMGKGLDRAWNPY